MTRLEKAALEALKRMHGCHGASCQECLHNRAAIVELIQASRFESTVITVQSLQGMLK